MPGCLCGGTTRPEYDEARGHTVCMGCGQVLEENAIVSEVTFGEKSNGAAVADGFNIASDQARASNRSRFGTVRQSSLESRQQTLQNGYRRIQNLASSLRINQRHIDAAQRYFNLAVSNNFTKGRRSMHVVAACLYAVCRLEKTSHMLIDFSDVLQVNVYVLGATFLKLVQLLHLNLPLVDPALYIARFAARLEFEHKTQTVISDALRLVQRMSRDWMHVGRRPAGICAAALFIAARMNGFRRTSQEIIHTVKICESTLRKRLQEFKETPSSELTVSDFQTIWLEQSADPPSFGPPKANRPDGAGETRTGGQRETEREEREEGEGEQNEDADGEEEEEGQENDDDGEIENGTTGRKRKASASDKENGRKKRKKSNAGGEGENGGKKKKQDRRKRHDDFEDDLGEAELAAEMKVHLSQQQLQELLKKLDMTDDQDVNDLSYLDDDLEIQGALLTPDEVEFKTVIWMGENSDWIIKQDAKAKANENKKPSNRSRGPRKKRDPISFPPAASAAEAARNLVNTKKVLSKKINYAVLDGLFEDLAAEISV
ncbi:transcription factor TFIIIB subunit brf1 [Quaeritorhiza haematococci]|nr:transcription factor TFIIIB subunit brf1 [Quaeritorhiza haematococci]